MSRAELNSTVLCRMKPPRSLKITDTKDGHGRPVVPGDVAVCHYRCTRSKGDVVFESDKHKPVEIRVGSRDCYVGLESGLLGMRTGGERKIVVPPNLTYNERKTFPGVSENSILIYKLVLVGLLEKWDSKMEQRLGDLKRELPNEDR